MLIDRNIVQAALEALDVIVGEREIWCVADTRPIVEALRAALEPTRSQKLTDAGFKPRPSLRAMEMRQTLELIAAPMRSDGTWNRDREACRQLASEALGRYDDDRAPPAQPEPVAWMDKHGNIDHGLDAILDPSGWTPLYASPPAPQQPLTDEEIDAIPLDFSESPIQKWWRDAINESLAEGTTLRKFARAVERAIRGEKP